MFTQWHVCVYKEAWLFKLNLATNKNKTKILWREMLATGRTSGKPLNMKIAACCEFDNLKIQQVEGEKKSLWFWYK